MGEYLERYLEIFCLVHCIVQVESLAIKNEVLFIWCGQGDITIEFGCFKICCGGGDWDLVWKFIASNYESHSMGFGFLGSDFAYYTAVCDLAYFWYLMLVNKKACVGALNISDSLEKASYIIYKFSCLFWFFGSFN